ncbi:hypothetical protein KCTCHS21_38940 [Cohnella abietis]|uniref:Uncharacterized protein n=1 Tax=Cohnella abietis TaxID=2507935 RepID=A0A3T1D8X2_9BACL|nr:hypothetical protein KCTCHS21_38940 [Cohnella abietis]
MPFKPGKILYTIAVYFVILMFSSVIIRAFLSTLLPENQLYYLLSLLFSVGASFYFTREIMRRKNKKYPSRL